LKKRPSWIHITENKYMIIWLGFEIHFISMAIIAQNTPVLIEYILKKWSFVKILFFVILKF